MKQLSTRRSFTQALTALAALTRTLDSQESQGSTSWKLGIITDEVDPNLSRTLTDFYPKYDLHWAEIRNLEVGGGNHYLYKWATPVVLRAVKAQLDDADVKVSVLDTAVFKIPLPGTSPLGENATDLNPETSGYTTQMEDLKRAAEAAHSLGTDKVRIFTFSRVAHPDAIFNRIVDELHKAVTVAEQQDVVLLVENEFDCNVGTGAETARLFKAVTNRRLMHNWDPGNCYEVGEQPFPKAWDQLDHSRIAHIHLKDASGKKWLPIGSGEIDFVGQFKALKQMGYSGTMSLETHYLNAQKDHFRSSVESMDGLQRILQSKV